MISSFNVMCLNSFLTTFRILICLKSTSNDIKYIAMVSITYLSMIGREVGEIYGSIHPYHSNHGPCHYARCGFGLYLTINSNVSLIEVYFYQPFLAKFVQSHKSYVLSTGLDKGSVSLKIL